MAPNLDPDKIKRYAGYLVGVVWLTKQFLANTTLARKGKMPVDKGARKNSEASYPHFRKDMRYLLAVCFPSKTCQESALLVGFVGVLLARTLLSLVIADVDGYMVKQLINKNKQNIARGIVMWLLIALPSSFINALIKYLQSRLALSIRSRLTTHVRELYFKDETYFKVSHLDKRVANPEHAMTEDIAQWGDRFADLLSSLGKPLVDLIFFSTVLFKSLGFMNQFVASVLVWETGKLLKMLRPNYAQLVQDRGTLEANLRLQHTRVIAASEEIAFCKGDGREKHILESNFSKIIVFTRKLLRDQIMYHTMEDFVTKYLWSVIGIVQVALPLIKKGTNAGDNAKYLITIRRMMIRNGDATERLMVGIKDVHEFSGFTRRVMDMVRVFREQQEKNLELEGHVTESENIDIRDLPIVTPSGDLLIEKMNLKLQAGDRLLILGPNGCGKSSLFRILCGLWPMKGGFIAKPANRTDLFFLPQKPYLIGGTFREQIIYPHTTEEARARGVTDADLLQCLKMTLMTSVCEAHGGLDAVKEWTEVLSGGEKQRLGIARVMYHRPKYAILDECSSAINVEAEQEIFGHLLELGMGLITISHRHTLFKFHTKVLTFDGCGNYNFNNQLQQTHLQGLTDRKHALMNQLYEVCRDLGVDWPKSALGPPITD
jgi:ATP-binding cassette subfamily D (ALD) long-chain fatty acid import protein